MIGFVDLSDDRFWRSRRSKQRQHLLREQARYSGFDRGRYFWRNRNARWIRDRQQAELAGAVKFKDLIGHGRDDHRDLAADGVGNRGAGAAIWHVRQIGNAGHDFKSSPLRWFMVPVPAEP